MNLFYNSRNLVLQGEKKFTFQNGIKNCIITKKQKIHHKTIHHPIFCTPQSENQNKNNEEKISYYSLSSTPEKITLYQFTQAQLFLHSREFSVKEARYQRGFQGEQQQGLANGEGTLDFIQFLGMCSCKRLLFLTWSFQRCRRRLNQESIQEISLKNAP
eukprot:TRINITY_DN6512_c0_g1_i7.p3 TRINITY_DN6512_c0_g1~~TRINITY_DN6512_c0_g1_i7.p3  ORF type:complete len:159 (-),score=8.82 TRINITY_DN6512_c0_g1_i7:70-546(-)